MWGIRLEVDFKKDFWVSQNPKMNIYIYTHVNGNAHCHKEVICSLKFSQEKLVIQALYLHSINHVFRKHIFRSYFKTTFLLPSWNI